MKSAAVLTPCPMADSWIRLLGGEVLESDRDILEEHLDRCDSCQRALEELATAPEEKLRMAADRRPLPSQDTLAMLARLARERLSDSIQQSAGRSSQDSSLPEIPGLTNLVEIGRGGMGVVYRALEVNLGRWVAVKVVQGIGPLDASARSRVAREARAMASLKHPNSVALHSWGEVDGRPYLVMELVEGGSLQECLNERGPFSADESAIIIRDLAMALSAAHSLGIVHRDLKPANVLMAKANDAEERSTPKIVDYGMALEDSSTSRLTQTGQILGTPSYMAPEQTMLNATSAAIGPSCDIHALGAILYALLTGLAPYRGETRWETMVKVASGSFEPIRNHRRDIPRDLESIMMRCLESQPWRRYPTTLALANDLNRYLLGFPVEARPPSAVDRLFKWCRRRPITAASLGVAFLSVCVLLTGLWYHIGQIEESLRSVKAEKDKTTEALHRSEVSRTRADEILATLIDETSNRMRALGGVISTEDRAFLAKIHIHLASASSDFDPNPTHFKPLLDNFSRLLAIYGRLGYVDEFLDLYKEFLSLVEHCETTQPKNDEIKHLKTKEVWAAVIMCLNHLRYNEAQGICLKLIEAINAESTTRKGYHRDLSEAYYFLTKSIGASGNLQEAKKACAQAVEIIDKGLAVEPDDPRTFGQAIHCYLEYLYVLGLCGEKDAADAIETRLEALIKTARERKIPPNFYQESELSFLGIKVARCEEKGDFASAAAYSDTRLALARELAGDWQRLGNDVIQLFDAIEKSLYFDSLIGRAIRHREEVESYHAKTLAILAREPAANTSYRLVYQTHLLKAFVARASRNPEQAHAEFKLAQDRCRPWLSNGSNGNQDFSDRFARSACHRAEELRALGRDQEAIAVLQEALKLCLPAHQPRVQSALAASQPPK